MIPLLLLVFLFGSAAQETQSSENQAKLVNRNELPNDLNLPFHDNGFTVVSVTIVNKGSQALSIDTAKIRALDPKNKPLVVATSSDVTPKMVKSGARVPAVSAGSQPVYVPGYGGYGRRPIDTGVTIGGGGGGVVDIGRVERLKAAIEKYQLKSTDVLTGEKVEGFLYLKTDKDPDQLKGTRIVVTDELTLTVE